MAKRNKTKESFEIENRLGEIEDSLTKTEQFIENNQKHIITAVLAVIVIVLGIFAFNKFYKAPKEEKAQIAMYKAQEYFSANEFQKALDGINEVGNQSLGFIQVIEKYGSTKAGNLARYYAGICYKNTGEYDKAISFLNDFTTEDFLLQSITQVAIGDSYFAKENFKEASVAYKKATEINPNEYSTPISMIRLGFAYEKLKDYSKALDTYKEIKTKYPRSEQSQGIDKFIARVQMQL